MKRKLFSVFALLVLLALPAQATDLHFPDFVTGLPLASAPGPTDCSVIIQGGASRKVCGPSGGTVLTGMGLPTASLLAPGQSAVYKDTTGGGVYYIFNDSGTLEFVQLGAVPLAMGGFPGQAGILNVKDHGAVGDGITDDTAAILATIALLPAYSTAHDLIANIVYFPAGTYKVSNTILRNNGINVNCSGGALSNFILLGADPTTTSIKLADSASGFTSSGTPKPIIKMDSGNFFGQGECNGEGNEAFNNSIENLTINAGTGNAGAVGVDWVVNNIGRIRNSKFVTTGAAACAICMERREVGPSLISTATVSGPWVKGISLAYSELSVTMEHVTVTGTTGVGITLAQNVFNMRDITVTPASGIGVQQTDNGTLTSPWGPNEGLMVWIDGVIGGNGTTAWDGTHGYSNFTNVHEVNFNGSTNADLSGLYTQTTKTGTSDWTLTVKNTPTLPGLPDDTWARCIVPVAPAIGTSALQACLNGLSGTPGSKVFLPNGVYIIDGQITIPDSVVAINFLHSDFQLQVATSYYVFNTNPTRTADLFVQWLSVENAGPGAFATVNWLAPSPARLIMTDVSGPAILERQPTAGEAYGEDLNSPHMYADGGSLGLWFRQLNLEGPSTKIFNVTAPVWILGFKTEQPSIAVDNDGGNVEILGGLHLAGTAVGSTPKLNNYNGGRISAAYVNEDLAATWGWTNEMVSLVGGVTNTILTSSFPQRGAFNGRNINRISTDDFVPVISFSPVPALVLPSASNGTVVGTAALTGYSFTGTPVWGLSSSAGGKYAINSSTGVVTVASALSAGTDSITITVSGITPSGTVPLVQSINVTTSHSLEALDPTKTQPNITASGGELVATVNTTDNVNGNIAGTLYGHSTGKYYFEATLTTQGGATSSNDVGIVGSAMSFASGNYLGKAGTPSIALQGTGAVFYNGTIVGNGVDQWAANGQRADIAVDADARLFWSRSQNGFWNGSATANPATGVGGIAIPFAGALFPAIEGDTITTVITLNFGATSFSGTAPAGFGHW